MIARLERGHGVSIQRTPIEGRKPAFIGSSDQDLIAELLLHREVRVRAVPTEHPVEKDLISIEDLHVHIGGRGVEHDRPS